MHTSDCVELRAFRSLCIRVGSVTALQAYLLCEAGEFRQLAELSIKPDVYPNASSFGEDYLIVNFLSKWKGLNTGIDTKAVALSKWISAEEVCLSTNNRFFSGNPGNTGVEQVLFLAQRKIASVLGSFSLKKVLSGCQWSGGATFDHRRGTPFTTKMSKVLSVTAPALKYLRLCVETDPNWVEAITGNYPAGPVKLLPNNFCLVKGCKFITVPKSAKTDRCIAVEPTGNAFLQQGVGQYIRRRLKRFNVDLDTQEYNQYLASVAFRDGYATVDLASASDTISHGLVWSLLPIDWYLYLDDIRSHSIRVDGEWRTLQKFSSMGNAFTFELETLIFWAISTSINELEENGNAYHVAVYGDDIIIHASRFASLCEVITHCGFEVNGSKSFSEGPFYESCGKHYFNGVDVTPVYQKAVLDGKPEEIIRCHNRLVRWAVRYSGEPFNKVVLKALDDLFVSFKKIWKFHHRIPRIPLVSPDDDGFLSSSYKLASYDPNHGYYCVLYRPKSNLYRSQDSAFLAYKLRKFSVSSADPKGHAKISGASQRWKITYGYRQSWEQL